MNKPVFISAVCNKLFEPEERRLDRIVTDLDKQNREIKGHSRHGFILGGTTYIPKSSPFIPNSRGYPGLCFSLTGSANEFLKVVKQIQDDKQYISQIMHLLIAPCECAEDIRNALPESLVSLAPQLEALPRTNAEAYTLIGNDRAMRQYQLMIDKIDFYSAMRLLC